MRLPYKKGCRISKLFGTPPPKGVTYRFGYHTGLDLVGIGSKEIVSCEAGKVTGHGFDTSGWGNWVKVRGESGLTAIYCHLSSRAVSVGQMLKEGDVIGIEGSTGGKWGSHLHLEFRRDHTDGRTAIDPCDLLEIEKKVGEVEKVEQDRRYDTLQEVPGWARPLVSKLIEKGYLSGGTDGKLDLSYDMIRILAILDRTGAFK